MTRKDYNMIAEMIRGQLSNFPHLLENPTQFYGFQIAVEGAAKALEVDNSKFDRVRFLQACGIEV